MLKLFRRTKTPTLDVAVTRLGAASTPADVVEVLRSSARALVAADGVTVVERQRDEVVYVGEDAIAPLWTGQRFPIAQCVSGWAFLHEQSVAIPDIFEDVRVPLNAYLSTFVRSMAVVPIDRRFAMGVYWREPRAIPRAVLDRVGALARPAAAAFARVGGSAPSQLRDVA